MKNKTDKNIFLKHFINEKTFTTNDIFRFFSEANPDIKKGTVNWRIHDLVKHGFIQRIGRGIYALGKEKIFNHKISIKQKKIYSAINRKFPFITYCLWDISVLKEFLQHIFMTDFLIIEVEKEVVSSVYHMIKEKNANTFKEPSGDILEDFILNTQNTIIIKPLISESPLMKENDIHVPSLEKILVDLFADQKLFYFLQGNELLDVFKNAMEKYTVNADKLLRYAKRRNKKNEIQKILNKINIEN